MKTQRNKHELVIMKMRNAKSEASLGTITTRRRWWVTKMQFKLCPSKNSILDETTSVMANRCGNYAMQKQQWKPTHGIISHMLGPK